VEGNPLPLPVGADTAEPASSDDLRDAPGHVDVGPVVFTVRGGEPADGRGLVRGEGVRG
jgi:hypothetical protein